jgi:hypothetical protein
MRRCILVILLVLSAGTAMANAAPDEDERDWLGEPPVCC